MLFGKSTLETLQSRLRKAEGIAADKAGDLEAATAAVAAAKHALDDILDESEAIALTAKLTVAENRKRKAQAAHAAALDDTATAQAAVDIESARLEQERRDVELAQALEAATVETYQTRTGPLARKAMLLFEELQSTLDQIDNEYKASVAASQKLAAAGWPVPEARPLSPGHRLAPVIREVIARYPSEQTARSLNQVGGNAITPGNIQNALDFAKRWPGIQDKGALNALLADRQLSEFAATEYRKAKDPAVIAARKRQDSFRTWCDAHVIPAYVSDGLRMTLNSERDRILSNTAFASEDAIADYKSEFARRTDRNYERPTGFVEVTRETSTSLTVN